jgi:DNA gyrase/topoisomerase IV subunit A
VKRFRVFVRRFINVNDESNSKEGTRIVVDLKKEAVARG